MQLEPVGYVKSPYPTKFGVPRQPGLAPSVQSSVLFKPEYRLSEMMLGLSVHDWVVILWAFSHNENRGISWSKTVRPPILGGVKRQGVFATRSSFRPNNLALSCVQVSEIGEYALSFVGGDMVDGTPVYDVYPYDELTDCVPAARGGWAGDVQWPKLDRVEIDDALLNKIPEAQRCGLLEVLIQDPRPAYTREGQEGRQFWTAFGNHIIHFGVKHGVLEVTSVETLNENQFLDLKRTGNITQ